MNAAISEITRRKRQLAYDRSLAIVRRTQEAAEELRAEALLAVGRGRPVLPTWVYFVFASHHGPVKIGFSIDPMRRLAEIQRDWPEGLRLVGVVPGGFSEEQRLHKRFSHLRLHGEWFRPDDELTTFIRETAHPWKEPVS